MGLIKGSFVSVTLILLIIALLATNLFSTFTLSGVSEWGGELTLSLIFSLVLIGVLFFLVSPKYKGLVYSGVAIVLSSLPFFKLNWITSFLEGTFLSEVSDLFANSYRVFIISISIGFLFILAGVFWAFYGKIIGFIRGVEEKDSSVSEEKIDKKIENKSKKSKSK